MRVLTAEEIRTSFVNVEPEESARIPLPGLHEVIWEDREYLGWRDPSLASRGYIVIDAPGAPVGIVVRRADPAGRTGIPAMCSLCRATQPAVQVSMFSAARAGQPGRDGASVGTYICDDLGCSHKIRLMPASSPWSPDAGDLLAARAAGLVERVLGFADQVTRPAR